MTHKVDKAKLKELALNLKFDMKDEEYETLQTEFEVILGQIDLIEKVVDTENVVPMSFPFEQVYSYLRDDDEVEELSREEVLANAKNVTDGQIKILKVVE